ncbi:BPSL0761 family protein [Paraburkholderia nemoris]|uniref:BPSL0761 family protein n=1 Tax=Paraburkholderia nemoris TaxID=2793076 RepID=UPI002E2B8ABD|nr:BPSL0761 family protein [Paraburkholderia nemoris]
MTTPDERTKSVLDTRDFLRILVAAEDIAIPGLIQSVAEGLLRHYPLAVDLAVSAAALPGIWADPSLRRRDGQQQWHASKFSRRPSDPD